MSKTLVIAEKPSVATDLSRVLAKVPGVGKFEKKGKGRDTYFENDKVIIASAVGHLVELKMPTGPTGKGLPWNFEVLPAIPEKFELQPVEKTEARLKQVLKLAGRKDVDRLINACDAGREGELIFRYIMEIGNIKKPVDRLWMQSMTNQAILDAWGQLRPDSEMVHLADAAKCRSEADWLVGLNSTRALTCFRSRHGGFNITAAGRVQTPTLAILAKREREIAAFVSEDYFEVHADFKVAAGEYEGLWFDPAFKKEAEKPHGRAQRLWDKAGADAIRDRCSGKTGVVTEEKKPTKQAPSLLYDLTTLQREAPFSATQTLQIAQALYERHKMLTYPRTDSRYLPEDYLADVKKTVKALRDSGGGALSAFAEDALKNNRIQFSKRIFDNSKISDHFAIIPTGHIVKLSDAEQKLYDMVAKRFLSVFFPPAEFEITKRLTTIDHGDTRDVFRTDGKVLVAPGYLAIYGRKPGVASGKDELVPVSDGEDASVAKIEVLEEETKPPARYSESTLLSAMEGAGKLLDDEELREAMSERGLGTPATRAAIIEGLLRQKYIARDGRELFVSGKGLRLISLLEEMHIDTLASPSMTGDWEYKLRQMEHGKLGRSTFMDEIVDFTVDIVKRAKNHRDKTVNRVFPDLDATCPKCGAAGLQQTDATYACRAEDCGFKGNKYIAGREISPKEAKELFARGFIGPLDGFRSRFNKPFEAGLKLDDKFKIAFVFDQDEPESLDDFTDDKIIGSAAFPGIGEAKIYETDKAYYIPDFKTGKEKAPFRLGRVILQQEITREDALDLLVRGKTKLLREFVSNRTKRKFSAHLTLDRETGKVGFEFAPRARKTAPPKKNAAATEK